VKISKRRPADVSRGKLANNSFERLHHKFGFKLSSIRLDVANVSLRAAAIDVASL
jgi:hypothetical protein